MQTPQAAPSGEYFYKLLSRTWSDTWDIVFNKPLVPLLAAAFIFGVSLLIHWQRKGLAEMKDALVVAVEGAAATIIVFVAFFAINLFLLTPKRLYEGVSKELKQIPKSEEPRIKLDVADEESRREISDLKKQLLAAQETINKQHLDRDPLSSPIASAKFTLLVNFKDKKEPRSNYFGAGAAVVLAAGGKTLLEGGIADHTSDGDGHSRVVFESPFDSPYMGKPVRSLSETQLLQIQFADGFVPIDTELEDGRVVLLINSQITLTFDVPAQKVTRKIKDGTAIVLTDVQPGLAPLAKQPSPTPDMGASQH